MRRSFWFIAALGAGLLAWKAPARAENLLDLRSAQQPPVLSGTVDKAPFPGVLPTGPEPVRGPTENRNPGGPSSLPSGSLPDEGSGRPSMGSLFELNRQETLLKKEIAIKRLKKQLSGRRPKKIIDTGTQGSPVTLLAAGIAGKRYAVLSFPDGRKIRVREGENLPDGTRVLRIDGSGVSVRKRGSVVTYPYGEDRRRKLSGEYPRFPGFQPPPPPQGPSGGRP